MIRWLLMTKTGRTVAMALAMTVGALISWYAFKTHYFNEGVAACEAKQLAARNDANVEQAAENEEKNKAASEVATKASDAAENVNKGTERAVAETKEVIRYVYRDPPKTAPVADGACVRRLDPRVQSAIGEARRAANDAGGSL